MPRHSCASRLITCVVCPVLLICHLPGTRPLCNYSLPCMPSTSPDPETFQLRTSRILTAENSGCMFPVCSRLRWPTPQHSWFPCHK